MPQSNFSFEQASIDLIIFDCDGVLIDSEVLAKRVLVSMLKSLGIAISNDYFERYFLGHSYKTVKNRVQTDFLVELPAQFRSRYIQELLAVYVKELQPTDKVKKMLSQLTTRRCVATSSSPERVNCALSTTGLRDYFGEQVYTSSQVKNSKPAPDLFLYAAKQMGVAPQNCLVIEDSQAGIRAALAANMRVIKYAGASHLKDKGIFASDIKNKVDTFFDWEELFKRFPALNSSCTR